MQRRLLLFIALLLLVTVTPVSAQEAEYELTYTSDIYMHSAEIGPDSSELFVSPDMPVINPFDDPPEVEAGKYPRHNKTFLTDMIVEITITETSGDPSDKEMDVFVEFLHTTLQIAFLYVNDGDTLSRGIGTEYSYQGVAAESLRITLIPTDFSETAIYEAVVTLYWTAQWTIRDVPEGELDQNFILLCIGLAVLATFFAIREWRD